MVVGVGTFAGLTAAIAAYFVEDDAASRGTDIAALRAELEQIRDQLTLLRLALPTRIDSADLITRRSD